jgi:hypothetical protein
LQVLGRELNAMVLALKSRGLALAWRNHDFEFAALAGGGSAMSALLDATPDLLWEMDVG